MLGHEDVAIDVELMADAESFELLFEEDSGVVGVEEWPPLVATEGDEVEVTFVLPSFEA
jgi:hypothetical protein